MYGYAKLLLCVCMCVCVCVSVCVCNRSGKFRGQDYGSDHDLRTYTLYCVGMITRGRTRGAAAEEDAVGEQQLEQTHSECSSF